MTIKGSFAPGDPVISAWISVDGHYAFVEFRTAEEANQGFLLNNIIILGQPLKVGRPKTYSGVLSMMDDNGISNTVGAALQGGTMNAPITGRKVQFPTKVLCFKSIIGEINIDDEEVYKELEEDIQIECSRYCKVVNIFMPRKDIEDNETPGMGNAYVEFNTVDDCKEVRKQLVGRRFNDRTLQMVYFSEEKYANRDFSLETVS